MSSMDVLDVGQANELKLACRRNNFTSEDLKWLCEGDNLANVRLVRLGHSNLFKPKYVIDYNADPFVPDGWKVEEHQKTGPRNIGLLEWSANKIELYFDPSQKDRGGVNGNKLREKLAGKSVLNANVLDYLLKNPQLIPEDWKRDETGNVRNIFFWGTIYRRLDGRLFVRYMYWSGHGWVWIPCWLECDWGVYQLAVVWK